MPRRMTIVFDDEALYTRLKVEAAFRHRPAKDIVAEALTLLFSASVPVPSGFGSLKLSPEWERRLSEDLPPRHEREAARS